VLAMLLPMTSNQRSLPWRPLTALENARTTM
jgi:hypothetical protein